MCHSFLEPPFSGKSGEKATKVQKGTETPIQRLQSWMAVRFVLKMKYVVFSARRLLIYYHPLNNSY